MTEDKKSTLCREHIYCSPCHLGNTMSPDTSRIDDKTATKYLLFLCMNIINLYTYHSVTFLYNSSNLMISKNIRSMKTRVKDICHCKSERIHCTVWNLYGSNKALVYRRLQPDSFLRVNSLRIDTRTKTGIHEG